MEVAMTLLSGQDPVTVRLDVIWWVKVALQYVMAWALMWFIHSQAYQVMVAQPLEADLEEVIVAQPLEVDLEEVIVAQPLEADFEEVSLE